MTVLQDHERSFIGALLIDPHYLPVARVILGSHDIWDSSCAHIWRAMLAGDDADPGAVAAALERGKKLQEVGGRDFLNLLLYETRSSAHLERDAYLIFRHARGRRLKQALEEAAAMIDDAVNAPDSEAFANVATEIELSAIRARDGLRTGSEIESICAADVVSEDVQMLWTPYMPLGKLVLLDGDPGCGKSYASLMVCGAFANGWGLPDPANGGHPGPQREPVNVAYASREDSIEDTLVPRLKWAGCNLQHIRFLTGVKRYGKGKAVPLTLQDVDALDREISTHRYALIVIDPLQSYLGPGVKMAEAETTRPILDALGALARKHRCTIVLIRHLRKGTADRAIYRGMGGMDFAGVARSMLMIGRDPDDKNLRVLAHAKASIGAEGDSLAFRINRVDDIKADFQWCGKSERDEDDIVAPAKEKGAESQEGLAKDMLYKAHLAGPASWVKVRAMLIEEHNFSRSVVYRAKEKIGLVKDHGEGNNVWYRLPSTNGNGWVEHDASR